MTRNEITTNLIIGLTGGISAGIGIWLIDKIRDWRIFKRDEKRIIEAIRKSGIVFCSTRRISSDVNLTEDRTRFVCSTSPKIRRNQLEKELWRIRVTN